MDLERLVALIVKTVVEELVRQDIIRIDPTEESPSKAEGRSARPPVESNGRESRVVSAQMILDAAKAGAMTYGVSARALVTPLAVDVAREKGIRIKRAGKG